VKCHHPDVFCAALLNAQPMGFYAPAQIVRDARQHGVEIRPIDVNHSRWDCTLEPTGGRYLAVRLGLRMVNDLANAMPRPSSRRAPINPESVEEIQRRAGVGRGALDRIGEADGFGSLGNNRREGLWSVKGLGNAALPCSPRPTSVRASCARKRSSRRSSLRLWAPARSGRGLSGLWPVAAAHPLAFLRDELRNRKMITCDELQSMKDGRWINLAGIVLVRQKPGSAKGVMFITLEDETNVANLVVWTNVFEKHRRAVLGASMMGVRGQVQREGEVIHVVAQRLDDLSPLLASVGTRTDVADIYRVSRADVAKHPLRCDPRDLVSWDRRSLTPPPDPGIRVRSRDFR
jgi:error-prone DNA polymerase